MNERLKELAVQAGLITCQDIDKNDQEYFDDLECFAELVRQNEREACANLADEFDDDVGQAISKAIRGRGNHEP